MATNDGVNKSQPIGDLYNWNTDRTVEPITMVRGLLGKTSGGSWVNVACTSGGFLQITTTP